MEVLLAEQIQERIAHIFLEDAEEVRTEVVVVAIMRHHHQRLFNNQNQVGLAKDVSQTFSFI